MIIRPMPRFGDQVWCGGTSFIRPVESIVFGKVEKKLALSLFLSPSVSLIVFLEKLGYCRKSTESWQSKSQCPYCIDKINRTNLRMHKKSCYIAKR